MTERPSPERPQVPDAAFSTKAVELGYATPEQIQECREVLDRMSSMGVQETLAAVLVKKGVLTQHQVTAVLRALGVQVQPIPGYVILDRVGKGGYGEVYRARQVSMDRLVALKILSPKSIQSPEFVERFFKEAQAAAKLNHRAIIQAYDAGCANGLTYFAMEFVPGETARDLVKRNGPFAETRALETAAEALDALAYIHRHRMIHRDIKPENFLIAQDGRVKICDFGLAKSQEVEDTGAREGYTLGTPYYMSPEQIGGDKNLDIRSDLYSLGATLFYLLTGRHVFEGKDMRAVMKQHLTAPPPAPSSVIPGLGRGTDQVVLKLLEKDRDRRYQTPEQAAEDVRRLLQGALPTHAGKGRPRRLWAFAAAGAAAAVALLSVAILLTRSTTPEPPPAPPPETAQLPRPQPQPGPAPIDNPTMTAPPAGPETSPPPPIDEREVRAEGAFTRAEIRFRELSERATRGEDVAEEWSHLESDYRAIERDHATTRYFLERKREAWDRAEACRQGVRRAEERSKRGVEAELAAARKSYEEG
jgi:serine/threonine protein kinase